MLLNNDIGAFSLLRFCCNSVCLILNMHMFGVVESLNEQRKALWRIQAILWCAVHCCKLLILARCTCKF